MLNINVDKGVFKKVVSGEQKEIYKEAIPHNEEELTSYFGRENALWKNTQKVTITTGEGESAKSIVALCSLAYGEGYPEWGAERGVLYYIIKVEKIEEVEEPVVDASEEIAKATEVVEEATKALEDSAKALEEASKVIEEANEVIKETSGLLEEEAEEDCSVECDSCPLEEGCVAKDILEDAEKEVDELPIPEDTTPIEPVKKESK
jgi:hypothetical protein